jgi:hypothetical protein
MLILDKVPSASSIDLDPTVQSHVTLRSVPVGTIMTGAAAIQDGLTGEVVRAEEKAAKESRAETIIAKKRRVLGEDLQRVGTKLAWAMASFQAQVALADGVGSPIPRADAYSACTNAAKKQVELYVLAAADCKLLPDADVKQLTYKASSDPAKETIPSRAAALEEQVAQCVAGYSDERFAMPSVAVWTELVRKERAKQKAAARARARAAAQAADQFIDDDEDDAENAMDDG